MYLIYKLHGDMPHDNHRRDSLKSVIVCVSLRFEVSFHEYFNR
jgi:hypothetical protein